ncbi:MAG TPA: hypothetical protein VHO27_13170 [Angustibacter sp.]|nr:hypothetical protein [Angustibacter sp.]
MGDPTFAAFAAAAGERACARHLHAGFSGDMSEANGALAEILFWWRTLDEAEPVKMLSLLARANAADARPGLIWARNVGTHHALAVGKRAIDGGILRILQTPVRADLYTAWMPWTELPQPRAKPAIREEQICSYRDLLSGQRTEHMVRRLASVFEGFATAQQ